MVNKLTLASALFLVLGAAPATQPVIKAWRDPVGWLPREAMPEGKLWKDLAMDRARSIFDQKLTGSDVRIRGIIAWQKAGKGYRVRTRKEAAKGIDCYLQTLLSDGSALAGLKEGQTVTVTGTVREYQIGNGIDGSPFLNVMLADDAKLTKN